MPRSKRVTAVGVAATAALIAGSAFQGPVAHAEPDPGTPPEGPEKTGDIRHIGPDYNDGKKLPLDRKLVGANKRQALAGAEAKAEVGDQKYWLAQDDVAQSIYAKTYTLRGVGEHIQVWVADDRAFPDGDCRNDLGLTDVTDEQVANFVEEFDSNIYPVESQAFSTPPNRDGTGAVLPGLLGLPDDYYAVDAEESDDVVVLVDNVKDANFYDPTTPDGQTYIAGFFYSVFNEYVDRNVMTIDAYDWKHRTGESPQDDTDNPDYAACGVSGAPRPHVYEGTFAHEYQHLLEYYEDSDEESWVNEGLSDYAMTLVGYVDPSIPAGEPGSDSHLNCFQGFADPAFGGAENSLTEWGDQGGPEILCDYGAAYTMMEYLRGQYGDAFLSELHRNDANGLEGLDATLDRFRTDKDSRETLHDWAAAVALDAAIDRTQEKPGKPGKPGKPADKGGKGKGHDAKDLNWFTIASMSARINWENAQNYESPGAPPNGSDYVRLTGRDGKPLTAKDLKSIEFDGAEQLEPTPVEWEVVDTPPDTIDAGASCASPPAEGSGPAALYSGCGNMFDRSIAREVSVPEGGANLTFDALWDIEEGWDFGFVQVSTDGGETWESLETEDTTTEHDPDAFENITENLPGFNGESGTWRPQTADLSAYAGQDVLVGFRYMTDPAATESGFWVRNIKVGDTELPAALDGWQTYSQINPAEVEGFTVQLIGYTDAADGERKGKPGPGGPGGPGGKDQVWHHTLRLDDQFRGSLGKGELVKALGNKADTVAAIVMYDDSTEANTQYARYSLKVNGVTQPGG